MALKRVIILKGIIMMKRIIIMLLVCLPMVAGAQARIGLVDSERIFASMPEKAAAEAQLKATGERLEAEHRMLTEDFEKKFTDYQSIAADSSTPAAITERRVRELQEADKGIKEFEEKAAATIAAERESLMGPIRTKIAAAIKAVGAEGGYELILDTAVTPVAYAGATTADLTSEVMTRLGL